MDHRKEGDKPFQAKQIAGLSAERHLINNILMPVRLKIKWASDPLGELGKNTKAQKSSTGLCVLTDSWVILIHMTKVGSPRDKRIMTKWDGTEQ